MLLNRQKLPPLFYSQILLALFLFMFCLLQGTAFSRFTSMVGYLSVPVLIWEIWRCGRLLEVPRHLVPLIPFFLFVLTCVAVIPLIPYAAPRAKTVFVGFVLFTSCYLIARMQANSRILQYAFVAVILGICAVILFDPSVTARADQRLKISSSLVGDDGGGLNASNLSRYFGMGMFMAAGLMLQIREMGRGSIMSKLIYYGLWGVLAVASFVIIVYSGSRQGLVWVLFVGAFLGVVLFRKNLILAIFAALVLAVVGGAGFAVFGKNTILYDRIVRVVSAEVRYADSDASSFERLDMIQYGLRMWQQSPLWGHGNEAFRVEYGKYSHNNYVELLANYGLIGFSFYYIPFLILSASLVPILRSQRLLVKNETAWILACIFACLVSNLFIPAYYARPALAFLGYIFGKGWFLVDVGRRQLHQPTPR